MPPRRILLADCDQMFVAVARLADPEGAGKAPLLIIGGRPGGRGVVTSASYEARRYGVRAGMPTSRAARLCPAAMFAPVPRGLCSRKHGEIRAVLERWAPVVEPASIDEFYLDLSGTEAVYRGESLEATARRLRHAVQDATGLTLSIGGGTNRLVAKLAAERAKPRPGTAGTGVLVVAPGDEAGFLASHDLADIPGVGPRLQAALGKYGLVSVPDALRIERGHLQQWLGARTGAWLHDRLRGRGSDEVAPGGEAKSMSHEETFPRDIASDEALVTRLGSELRAEGLSAGRITVKLRDHDFRTRQSSRSIPLPVRTDRALFEVARPLLAGLRARRRVAARLLGVSFSSLTAASGPAQLSLLEEAGSGPESPRDRSLATAVDRINERLGREAIAPARLVRSGGPRSPSPPR